MLPHKLSNGICSLNENVDRLTVTCEMEIDNAGKVVSHDIYESVINSKKRMTYNNVNKILENNEVVSGYEEFVDDLKLMAELAKILRTYKEKRGYIEFDSKEIKVIVDEKGIPTDVQLREQRTGENLIEDFMIAANETVATHIFWMDLPFVYRIHEEPKEMKIKCFIDFVNILGYRIKGKSKDFSPLTVQGILESLKDKKEFPILSDLLLRSMQKAIYSPENKGQYGLASKCYTHFTSPIRRYPDTTVHRLLRTYLFNNEMDNNTKSYWQQKLVPLCEHSSIKEQDADECERDVDDLKTAEYMEKHVGEEYEGMISSVLGFGMFIMLDNGIEGLVHVNDMSDDYYNYNEISMSLIGQSTKKVYRIGDRVSVKVIAASKEERTIDFMILKKL
jgi:ribonuclease R